MPANIRRLLKLRVFIVAVFSGVNSFSQPLRESALTNHGHGAGGGGGGGGGGGADDSNYSTHSNPFSDPDSEYHSLDNPTHHQSSQYIENSPEFYPAPPSSNLSDLKFHPHFNGKSYNRTGEYSPKCVLGFCSLNIFCADQIASDRVEGR